MEKSTYKRRLDGVFDQDGNPIEAYDSALGHLEDREKTIRHDAIEGVEEQGHWETVAEYPNGGKDVKWIVEVAGVEAVDAWDEKVVYSAYIPYTQEELEEMERLRSLPTAEEQLAARADALEKENVLLRAQVQALCERGEFVEDCLAEMAAAVYQ